MLTILILKKITQSEVYVVDNKHKSNSKSHKEIKRNRHFFIIYFGNISLINYLNHLF